jgi:hypothetical protein
MTRTHNKHVRVYVNGVDLSGYSKQIGPLGWVFGAEPDTAMTDGAMNILIGQADIQAGTLNAFLDNDAAGLFANQAQGERNLAVAIGANAAPAAGDPVFAWKFQDIGYMVEPGSGFVAATLPFGGPSTTSTLTYERPWGVCLHPKGAETAASTATGIDDVGAATSLGGIFVYHLTSSNGTCTLSVDDAATNSDGNFAALSGATSGSINASVTPQSGMIALSTSATVRRYLRFQIAFGTATTATFFSAFIRNNLA